MFRVSRVDPTWNAGNITAFLVTRDTQRFSACNLSGNVEKWLGAISEGAQPMEPEALMRSVVAAFAEGDLKPLMSAADSEIVWKSASSRTGLFRFGGIYKKTNGLIEVLSEITSRYTFRRFEPREILSSGEVVFGLFDVELVYRSTADARADLKPIVSEFVLRWRVRNDKILEHQAFFDTASMLVQQS